MAHAKPEPAKVAPAAAGPLELAGALEAGAVLAGALEAGALLAGALEAGPLAAGLEAAALDAEDAAGAALDAAELAELAELLLDEAVLLSLPQAAIVRAPATSKATRPVLRVIFTPFPPQVVDRFVVCRSGDPMTDPAGHGAPLRRCTPDVKGVGWTIGRALVNAG